MRNYPATVSDTPNPLNPSNLYDLLESNRKWAAAVTASYPNFFPGENEIPPQTPKILWIGCSDSRVPENTIFAAMPGAIFSTRNIANQVLLDDDNAFAVISFAVRNLKVEHIVVAGHSACGGVDACYRAVRPNEKIADFDCDPANDTPPPRALDRWLEPLTQHARKFLGDNQDLHVEDLIKENVRLGIENVLKSECVREAWSAEQVASENGPTLKGVHGVLYHLETGIVEDLGISKTHLDIN